MKPQIFFTCSNKQKAERHEGYINYAHEVQPVSESPRRRDEGEPSRTMQVLIIIKFLYQNLLRIESPYRR